MSDYRIEVKVKNNNLLRKLEECGYTSVGEFCRGNDKIHWNSTIGEFVNLKKSPLNCKGRYLSIVEQICDILLCSPEDLFSEVQLTTAVASNRHTLEVNEAEMKYLIDNQREVLALEDQTDLTNLPSKIGDLLETLTPREAKVIAMRFGLGEYLQIHTLSEVGNEFGVTANRIRDIEGKALLKLRHPTRHSIVRDYVEGL